MLNKEEIENIKKGLTEELGRTIEANECGLSTNDFSESIKILEGSLKYIKQLEQDNIALKKGKNSLMQSRKKWKNRYYKLKTNKKKTIKYLEKKISEYDDTIIELVLQNVLSVLKGEKE